MLLSTLAIENLNFGVLFPQKYSSECHVCHIRVVKDKRQKRNRCYSFSSNFPIRFVLVTDLKARSCS